MNFTNNTNTNTTFSFTMMPDQFQEYLDNPLFIPLIILSWLFLVTNNKYRRSLVASESFKAQSADEVFFLQQSLAKENMINTLRPCCANTADEIFSLQQLLSKENMINTLCPCCANAATLSTSYPQDTNNGDILYRTTKTHEKKSKQKSKQKQKQKQKSNDCDLFIKKTIADIKRNNPGIQHQLAFMQATKKWQSNKA